MTVKNGTRRLAPLTNIRLTCRTSAVFSASGPTMNPGVSHRNSSGRSNAPHSCMNRAALSAQSASIAPARWSGLLASTPSGLPSIRISADTMPGAKCGRSSSADPVSATKVTTSRTS